MGFQFKHGSTHIYTQLLSLQVLQVLHNIALSRPHTLHIHNAMLYFDARIIIYTSVEKYVCAKMNIVFGSCVVAYCNSPYVIYFASTSWATYHIFGAPHQPCCVLSSGRSLAKIIEQRVIKNRVPYIHCR
jgi:hypothetical protein